MKMGKAKVRMNKQISIMFTVIFPIMICFSLGAFGSEQLGNLEEKSFVEPESKPTIVALAPNIVEILFEIGAGDQIVGVTEHTDFPSEAKKLPVVANYLGVQSEAVLALNPDLVIIWKGGTPQKDIDKLKSLGLDVINFNAESFVALTSQIKVLGQYVGHEKAANELATNMLIRFKKVVKKYSTQEPLTAFIEIWPNPLTTATAGTIIGKAAEHCGLVNVYADKSNSFPQASLESLLVKAIEVIVQPNSASNPTVVKDWSQYRIIPAVKNNAIVKPNSDALFRWAPRWVNELESFCKAVQTLRNTV